ncbi:hypothetical protein [Priestia megaterium]|nr:hypothetical protein [Priestia megaterium]
MVIGGAPAGETEQVRPSRSVCDEEDHRPGKATCGTEINGGITSDTY